MQIAAETQKCFNPVVSRDVELEMAQFMREYPDATLETLHTHGGFDLRQIGLYATSAANLAAKLSTRRVA